MNIFIWIGGGFIFLSFMNTIYNDPKDIILWVWRQIFLLFTWVWICWRFFS